MLDETQISQLATDAAKEKHEKLNQSYAELKDAFETEKIIEVDVLDKVKGGFKVSYNGIPIFLPTVLYTSKRDLTDEELFKIVGKKLPIKVKEYTDSGFGKEIKINHKDVIEDQLWKDISVGTKVEINIKSIIDKKGVLVNLINGLEAFIPISLIARERIEDISNYVAVGDKINGGEIIEVNRATNKIIVSLRNAPSKHLNSFFDNYKIGDRVTGKLRNIIKTRAFFTISPNIDGSVKMSEVSWTRRNINFNDFFESDKEYDFEIKNLDRDNQFIDLSYKKTQPDNWQEIANKYEEGYTYSAVVEFIPPNGSGVDVSVNNEIDGFMPKQRAGALYNGNKPTFKAKDVIQVKLVEKNEKTRVFFFESAIKQVNPFDLMGTSVATGKNISKPEVIKNFTLADLLSDSSKKALK